MLQFSMEKQELLKHLRILHQAILAPLGISWCTIPTVGSDYIDGQL